MTNSIAEIAARLKSDVEARNAELKTNIESFFETSNAKLMTDTKSPTPKKTEAPTKPDSAGNWLLSRKPWSWMYRD
jgi:hypothetical protein